MNKKLYWIENARTAALISVILLHVAGQGLYSKTPVPAPAWVVAAFFESFRFGVPVFIMITGALVLSKEIEVVQFYKTRFHKIVLPFITFSLIYIAATFGIEKLISEGLTQDLIWYTYKGFINGAFYHLWYVYLLINLYVITPILQIIIKRLDKKNLEILLGIWLIYIISYGYNSGGLFDNKLIMNFLGYTGYYISGYYVLKYLKPSRLLGILLFTAGLLSTFVLTYSSKTLTYYEYNTLNVFFEAAGMFIFLKAAKKNYKLRKTRNFINKYSYTVYLLHAMILLIMIRCGVTWDFYHPAVGILISTLLCLVLSVFVASILKQIPFIKNIT